MKQIEKDQIKQDQVVHDLDIKITSYRNKIKIYQAQIVAQQSEIKSAESTLLIANNEINMLKMIINNQILIGNIVY